MKRDPDVASGSTHKAFPMTKENREKPQAARSVGCFGGSPHPKPHLFYLVPELPNVLSIEKLIRKDRASLSELVAFRMATRCIRSPRRSCELNLAALCTGSILMCNIRKKQNIYIILFKAKKEEKKKRKKIYNKLGSSFPCLTSIPPRARRWDKGES